MLPRLQLDTLFITRNFISEDCEQFKNECNELCLDRTDGVWTSECWGGNYLI